MQNIVSRATRIWLACFSLAFSLMQNAYGENFQILVDHEPSPASGMLENVSSGNGTRITQGSAVE